MITHTKAIPKQLNIALIRCPQPELTTADGDLLSPNRHDTPEPSLPQVHGILDKYSRERGVEIKVTQIDLRDPGEGNVRRIDYGEVRVPYAGKLTKVYSGVPISDMRSTLEEADFVGITNNFTFARGVVETHIREIRRMFPDKEIWIGGRDVYPESIENIYAEAAGNRNCVVFRGHVFQSLGRYLDFKLTGNCLPSGVVIFDGIGTRMEWPVEQLPKGEFDFPLSVYTPGSFGMSLSGEGDMPDKFKPLAHMTISVGCPHKCGYCTTSRRENVMTYKSLEMIRQELEMLKRAGVKTVSIMDDNLLVLGPHKVMEIMELVNGMDFYTEYGNGIQLSLLNKWWDSIAEPILENCISLYAPIEDLTSDRFYRKLDAFSSQQDLMGKILAAPGSLKYLTMGVIVGVPGHTREGLFETLPKNITKLLNLFEGSSLEVAATMFNFMPLAGTYFGDMAQNSGRMVADPREHPELISFGTTSFVPEGFTANEIFSIYTDACNLNPAGRKFGVKYTDICRRGEGAFPKELRDKIPKEWRTKGLHYRARVDKKMRLKR